MEQLLALQEQTQEIMQGMTIEQITPLLFNKSLIEPAYEVFQLNSKGYRYYYRFEEGEPVFYPSVTTVISQTTPKSPYLEQWKEKVGNEYAKSYMMERAAYGTFMHAIFAEYLIAKSYDLDKLKEHLRKYVDTHKLGDAFMDYADELKKDLLSFAKFVYDYEVEPLAIEIGLVHPEKGYAGMIDLVCTMLKTPSSKERIRAQIDFKSGRKGFYESHEIQLHMYKDMWNINFPAFPIDQVFNFSPKEWRKRPNYNLKNQTESKNAAKIPYILELATIEDEKKNNSFTATHGIVSIGSDLSDNITSLTLSDIVKSKKERKPKEEGELSIDSLGNLQETPKEVEKKATTAKTIKSDTTTTKKKKEAPKAPKNKPAKKEESKKDDLFSFMNEETEI